MGKQKKKKQDHRKKVNPQPHLLVESLGGDSSMVEEYLLNQPGSDIMGGMLKLMTYLSGIEQGMMKKLLSLMDIMLRILASDQHDKVNGVCEDLHRILVGIFVKFQFWNSCQKEETKNSAEYETFSNLMAALVSVYIDRVIEENDEVPPRKLARRLRTTFLTLGSVTKLHDSLLQSERLMETDKDLAIGLLRGALMSKGNERDQTATDYAKYLCIVIMCKLKTGGKGEHWEDVRKNFKEPPPDFLQFEGMPSRKILNKQGLMHLTPTLLTKLLEVVDESSATGEEEAKETHEVELAAAPPKQNDLPFFVDTGRDETNVPRLSIKAAEEEVESADDHLAGDTSDGEMEGFQVDTVVAERLKDIRISTEMEIGEESGEESGIEPLSQRTDGASQDFQGPLKDSDGNDSESDLEILGECDFKSSWAKSSDFFEEEDDTFGVESGIEPLSQSQDFQGRLKDSDGNDSDSDLEILEVIKFPADESDEEDEEEESDDETVVCPKQVGLGGQKDDTLPAQPTKADEDKEADDTAVVCSNQVGLGEKEKGDVHGQTKLPRVSDDEDSDDSSDGENDDVIMNNLIGMFSDPPTLRDEKASGGASSPVTSDSGVGEPLPNPPAVKKFGLLEKDVASSDTASFCLVLSPDTDMTDADDSQTSATFSSKRPTSIKNVAKHQAKNSPAKTLKSSTRLSGTKSQMEHVSLSPKKFPTPGKTAHSSMSASPPVKLQKSSASPSHSDHVVSTVSLKSAALPAVSQSPGLDKTSKSSARSGSRTETGNILLSRKKSPPTPMITGKSLPVTPSKRPRSESASEVLEDAEVPQSPVKSPMKEIDIGRNTDCEISNNRVELHVSKEKKLKDSDRFSPQKRASLAVSPKCQQSGEPGTPSKRAKKDLPPTKVLAEEQIEDALEKRSRSGNKSRRSVSNEAKPATQLQATSVPSKTPQTPKDTPSRSKFKTPKSVVKTLIRASASVPSSVYDFIGSDDESLKKREAPRVEKSRRSFSPTCSMCVKSDTSSPQKNVSSPKRKTQTEASPTRENKADTSITRSKTKSKVDYKGTPTKVKDVLESPLRDLSSENRLSDKPVMKHSPKRPGAVRSQSEPMRNQSPVKSTAEKLSKSKSPQKQSVPTPPKTPAQSKTPGAKKSAASVKKLPKTPKTTAEDRDKSCDEATPVRCSKELNSLKQSGLTKYFSPAQDSPSAATRYSLRQRKAADETEELVLTKIETKELVLTKIKTKDTEGIFDEVKTYSGRKRRSEMYTKSQIDSPQSKRRLSSVLTPTKGYSLRK